MGREERRMRLTDEAIFIRGPSKLLKLSGLSERRGIVTGSKPISRSETGNRGKQKHEGKLQKAAREEEERKRREAFNAHPRDRTSKTRSTHSRSHPYARSVKLGRSHSGLLFKKFNPSNSPHAPTAKLVNPLVAPFERYGTEWKDISSMSSGAFLTFASIPWPLLIIPQTLPLRAFSSSRATRVGPNVTRPKQLRHLAMKELKNSHSDKFTTRDRRATSMMPSALCSRCRAEGAY